jgi:hypothetical protein
MNVVIQTSPPVGIASATSIDTQAPPKRKVNLLTMFAMLGALLATAASLGIATFAGWQRGGLPVERAMNIMLCNSAVLYVHLLPIGWPLLRMPARICAFALWWIGVAVVLYGQITFLMVSQQHAGSERAASATATVMSAGQTLPSGRSRTVIAQDVAKVTADLARVDARRCEGDCPTLTVHRDTLAARLEALNIESDEARRREAEDDRRIEQSDRDAALRASLRADPVALAVASWVHTTENRLELILAVACAVVLEGTAVLSWLLVSLAFSRATEPATDVTGRASVVHDRCPVALPVAADRDVHCAVVPSQPSVVATGGGCPAASDDDVRLGKIHDAVVAGRIRRTQGEIRMLLSCSQREAGRLNRLYSERKGDAQ